MSEHDFPPDRGQSPSEAGAPEDENLTDEAIADAISKNADADAPPAADAEEVAKLKDQVLRLAAELENTRRRAERDKVDVARYAITEFARDLLGVADNFERALAAADEHNAPNDSETLSSLIAGLRMTERELLQTLERHGVQRIDPKGEKFDPNHHQAVAQVPSTDVPTGHVVDVAQLGFMIKDRVLRAAMVTVSNGQGAPSVEDPDASRGAHIDTKA